MMVVALLVQEIHSPQTVLEVERSTDCQTVLEVERSTDCNTTDIYLPRLGLLAMGVDEHAQQRLGVPDPCASRCLVD